MHWWFPGNASSIGGKVDSLFYVILYVTGAVFVLTEATLIVFLVRYRHREGRKASYVEGSTKAEIIWTAIPAAILVAIALVSLPLWAKIKQKSDYPTNAARLGIEAKQYQWNVTYPGPDGKLGSDDDFMKVDTLRLIVNRDYVIDLTARDVVHSFFVPAFRIKQDLVPGMDIKMWVRPTKTGVFELACAELCGLGHYRMRGLVFVETPQQHAAWLVSQDEASAADSAEAGVGAPTGGTGTATPPSGKGAS
jgi:cytochrome c oxidase subunit 2